MWYLIQVGSLIGVIVVVRTVYLLLVGSKDAFSYGQVVFAGLAFGAAVGVTIMVNTRMQWSIVGHSVLICIGLLGTANFLRNQLRSERREFGDRYR